MDIFNALAQPTRREIIELLARRGQLSASDIYHEFDMTPPAVSQHLKVLREARVVSMEKRRQQHMYKINTEAITELEDWVHKMKTLWNARFDRLDEVLREARLRQDK